MKGLWFVYGYLVYVLVRCRLPGSGGIIYPVFQCKRDWLDKLKVISELKEGLNWLSPEVGYITMREIRRGPDSRWTFDEVRRQSHVEVERVSSTEFQLKGLNPEVEDCLLKGEGQYAIVTIDLSKVDNNGYYKKLKDIIVRGISDGRWEIVRST